MRSFSFYGTGPGAVVISLTDTRTDMLQIFSSTEKVCNHRFDHFSSNPMKNLKDVYDGKMYQKLYKNGLLKNPNNISFSMNTDGAHIFKSSKVSMWPVYLLVNELPVKERKARENTIFYGVWISARKPMMWSFLKPLYTELSQEEGVDFVDHNGMLQIFSWPGVVTQFTMNKSIKTTITFTIMIVFI